MSQANPMSRFQARFVSIEDSAEAWLVGFADNEYNPRNYLRLQRDRAPSSADIELGLDAYHLELNDPTQTAFGGIAAFELYRDRVMVELDDETASVCGDVWEISIDFTLGDMQFRQLKDRLAKMFQDDNCFMDMTA